MDFSKIRGLETGQRQSFESLMCQLAKRDRPAEAKEFRRVEGAGGDGGVEAYWLLTNGSKIGYQAKFFTRTGSIDWAQIDESVEQAINTHPTLIKYVVALACDLTDKAGVKGKGATGWEHWQTRVAKWNARRAELGLKGIDFVAWPASELSDKLMAPDCEGVMRYWFGGVEFSDSWFKDHVERALTSLEERFHPEDHVEVEIERLFEVIGRSKLVKSEIQDFALTIEDGFTRLSSSTSRFIADLQPDVAAAGHIVGELQGVLGFAGLKTFDPWPIAASIELARELVNKIGEFQRKLISQHSENDNSSLDKSTYQFALDKCSGVVGATDGLISFLDSKYFQAESDRCALIDGKAGTGKSHLLGNAAQKCLQNDQPVLLVLGQQLRLGNVWQQITSRLELTDISPEAMLQALNAKAEAQSCRGLILVDAINEGAGAALWRNELAEFFSRVRKYPNLAIVVSCRTEYTNYIVSEAVLKSVEKFRVYGFASPGEQRRAAKVYLSNYGISHPNNPWLASEFVNPLFLRSACMALVQLGTKQFPVGLHGAKSIFSFYLKSVAVNLGAGYDGSSELYPSMLKSLLEIAKAMAFGRNDFISKASAEAISNAAFTGFPIPIGLTWLTVLLRNGLVRLDPNPLVVSDDPFALPDDVIRFSFQRLQDHLIAESLLDATTDISAELETGILSFVLKDSNVRWEWSGLVEALSIQVPKKFGIELFDVMPGDSKKWLFNRVLREAFAESVRWRDTDAFTDRTLEVFNELALEDEQYFFILIELCAGKKHPWNAEFLHDNLIERKLADRDAFWTVRVNELYLDEGGAIERLWSWSIQDQTPKTDGEVQYLCSLTLAWLTTASNREVRDYCTKALISLFVAEVRLYDRLCAAFSTVDDLYILERVHAAGYGASCIDPTIHRLKSYAGTAYNYVFNKKDVPLSLLVRDYALGIVERAVSLDCLDEGVDLNACRPPYSSAPAKLNFSDAKLKRVASAAGGDTIYYSCACFMGDFASYEVKPRVRDFLDAALTSPAPKSPRKIEESFKAEVIAPYARRAKIFEKMQEQKWGSNPFTELLKAGNKKKTNIDEAIKAMDAYQADLMALLSDEEKTRYTLEYSHNFDLRSRGTRQLARIDVENAQRWVAQRAYKFGWTSKLFPDDKSRSDGSHTRQRALTERIGKKYQWLALDELLCRLADNYWLAETFNDDARMYKNPLDVGFHRDIDPTILTPPTDEQKAPSKFYGVDLCAIDVGSTSEDELSAWPFSADFTTEFPSFISRVDASGRDWLTLYEYASHSKRYEDGRVTQHGLRQEEWRFLLPVIIDKKNRRKFIQYIEGERSIDVDSWSPAQHTDAGFLLEAPWRPTWPQGMYADANFRNGKSIRVAIPCVRYLWESHLDCSLPSGANMILPAPWLARDLKLNPSRGTLSSYSTTDGNVQYISSDAGNDGSYAFVDRIIFDDYIKQHALTCVWLFVAERSVWPGGANENAAWRRAEGIIWFERGKPKMSQWVKDEANGRSKEFLPESAED